MIIRPAHQEANVAWSRNGWPMLYGVVLAFLFLVAAYERFHLPLAPLADPDSWGYVGPPLLKLSGAGFQHTEGRNFLYPGFLLLILRFTHNLAAITIVQHFLGLATGGLVIGCWAKTKPFVRHLSPTSHEALGLGVVAIYLLSRHPIEYEHLLRPESITPFFAMLNIFLTLHFFDKRRNEGPSKAGSAVAALLLVNSALLAMLKTSFALTILFSVVPVVIALFSRRERWPGRVLVVLLGLIAAGAVLRTEQVLAASDPVAKSFLPTSLFTIHAKLIARQMDEDLARGQCGARGCDWLRQIDASLHEEIEKSRHSWRLWRSLGFYPDYLMYEDSLRRWRARFFDGDTGRQLEFYTYYYLRTLQMHPGRMAAKVIDQLAQFYLGYKKSLLATPQVKLAPRYAHTLNDLQPYLSATASYPPFARYLKEVERLSSSNDTLNQPVIVTLVGGLLAFLYPPVFFATVGTVCFLPPRLRRLYGSLALIALFAFSYNFGNCLGTAILHSLDVTRYIVVQYSFTLLAECIGLLFLVDLGLEQLRANRSAS